MSYTSQDQELSRRIFMVFYRTAVLNTECCDLHELLPTVEERQMLSAANLIDLASIYAEDNISLCREIVLTSFMMRPKLNVELAECASTSAEILVLLADSLESHSLDDPQSSEVEKVLLQLWDMAESLSALASISPEFAKLFVKGAGTDFFSTLGRINEADIHGRSFGRIQHIAQSTYDALAKSLFCILEGAFLNPSVNEKSDPIEEGEKLTATLLAVCCAGEGSDCRTLHQLEKRFGFSRKLAEARSQGLLNLDDIQHGYLMTILGVSKIQQEQLLSMNPLVQQMKQALPDHHEEFLEACLNEYGNRADEAIMHILEGSLPRKLLRQLKVQDSVPDYPTVATNHSHTKIKEDLLAWKPRKRVEDESARLLDHKNELEKDRILVYAEAVEYEDEYDDSFDALNEVGVQDVEGEAPEYVGIQPGSSRKGLKKFYTKDGKVYHRPIEGGEEILAENVSQASEFVAKQEADKAKQIHGLGPGGNKAEFPVSKVEAGGKTDQPQQRTMSHARKEKHKSTTANHNRRTGFLKKMSKGM
uniref:CUE domain-containing protein n=1 Tax=Picocystis salinarum TaxID=88271 RepID=A0A7S3U9G0_9CHLO